MTSADASRADKAPARRPAIIRRVSPHPERRNVGGLNVSRKVTVVAHNGVPSVGTGGNGSGGSSTRASGPGGSFSPPETQTDNHGTRPRRSRTRRAQRGNRPTPLPERRSRHAMAVQALAQPASNKPNKRRPSWLYKLQRHDPQEARGGRRANKGHRAPTRLRSRTPTRSLAESRFIRPPMGKIRAWAIRIVVIDPGTAIAFAARPKPQRKSADDGGAICCTTSSSAARIARYGASPRLATAANAHVDNVAIPAMRPANAGGAPRGRSRQSLASPCSIRTRAQAGPVKQEWTIGADVTLP